MFHIIPFEEVWIFARNFVEPICISFRSMWFLPSSFSGPFFVLVDMHSPSSPPSQVFPCTRTPQATGASLCCAVLLLCARWLSWQRFSSKPVLTVSGSHCRHWGRFFAGVSSHCIYSLPSIPWLFLQQLMHVRLSCLVGFLGHPCVPILGPTQRLSTALNPHTVRRRGGEKKKRPNRVWE